MTRTASDITDTMLNDFATNKIEDTPTNRLEHLLNTRDELLRIPFAPRRYKFTIEMMILQLCVKIATRDL